MEEEQSLRISIFGPSGAGKSQLAKRTATVLGDDIAARVPTDDFFIPRPEDMPLPDFLKQPLRYDWPLLDCLLSLPLGTPVSTPNAAFTDVTRYGDTGGREFAIRPVMLMDAMVVYPAADVVVRLDVDPEVRRARIADRDLRWQSNVLANWEHLERTWEAGRIAAPEPDLVLDGTRPLNQNAEWLATWILEWRQAHDGPT